jgi:tyrosyl-tRNA synthetase
MGGTDQLFNLNVGRDIMPAFGLEAQVVMTVPLLVGLDGVEKMSKSLGNYVGVSEAPNDMFGKLMSISDELMWTYYQLLTDRTPSQVEQIKLEVAEGRLHPKRAKLDLARAVTADFHSADDAAKAEEWFEHGRKQIAAGDEGSTDAKVFDVTPVDGKVALAKLLVDLGWAPSSSEAGRTIKQGGLRINGDRIAELQWRPANVPARYTLQVGAKRHAILNVLG